MSDYQSSPSHRKLAERSLYLLFCYAVKGRGGFVEYEYRRVFKEYSGYGYSLFLASREESSPLSHVSVEAVLHVHYILIYLRFSGGLRHFFKSGFRSSVSYIFKDCGGKEKYILLNDSYVASQRTLRNVPYVDSVYSYTAAVYIIKSRYQLAHGSLSSSGGAYDCHTLACSYAQGDVF